MHVQPFSLTRFAALGSLALTLLVAPEPTVASAQEPTVAEHQSSSGRGPAITVATYNIHHAAGNDVCTPPPATTPPSAECALNLERIADIVRGLHADVVGLQEVDRLWGRSGTVDQATRLGVLTRMAVCYGGNLDHQADSHSDRPHQYGTLILTKLPLLACWNTLLPKANATSEQRGLLHALVGTRGGTPLHVYNTHLHTAFADRAVQVAAVDALIGTNTPAVLVGDLNAQPTESTLAPLYARFTDAWASAGTGDGFTFPASPDQVANRRIDYIFVTPDLRVDEAEVIVTPTTALAADHYPVVARIRLGRRD